MFIGKNRNWLTKALRLGVWLYTGLVALAVLGLALFNPGNVFGESEIITLGWLRFPTYAGQSTALQLLGTFIASMGIMVSLIERRLTGNVPLALSIPAMVGALVVMAGLAIQDLPENYVAPAVLGALWVSVAPIWILAAAWAMLKRGYAWLKARRKSGG